MENLEKEIVWRQEMIKIVYFDDESATDILNIQNGGNLIETSVNEKARETKVGSEANVNIGVGIK